MIMMLMIMECRFTVKDEELETESVVYDHGVH